MATKPRADDGWDAVPSVEAGFEGIVKFDALGDSVVGRYEGIEHVPDRATGEALTVHVLTIDGERKGVWGSYDLTPRMAKVMVSQEVRITWVDERKLDGARSPMKVYRVQAR